MRILKFGGTSVGSPEAMNRVAGIVTRNGRKWVVLSAIAGTTDRLIRIEGYWKDGDENKIKDELGQLEQVFDRFVYELYVDPLSYNKGSDLLNDYLVHLNALTSQPWSVEGGRALIAHGELISAGLFFRLLKSKSVPAYYVCATDLIHKNKDGSVDINRLERQTSLVMSQHPETSIFITQGFICLDHAGNHDNLGRGGSDYTATLLGNVLNAEEIEIWTDVDGMHNGDPRVITHTRSIAQLSYDEADELAYFGAKVLYPRCVFPAKQKQIPIRIKHTMNPDAPGTVISGEITGGDIKAVAGKDGITAIRIRSGRMLMAYGFLKRVFEVFEQYETPIDMITTSEVSVSLSIDDHRHLESIVQTLRSFGEVDVEHDQSIICVVGDFMSNRKGVVRHVLTALEEIPLRMISYGGSMNNVSLLIAATDKKRALEALHHYFFINRNAHVV